MRKKTCRLCTDSEWVINSVGHGIQESIAEIYKAPEGGQKARFEDLLFEIDRKRALVKNILAGK